MYRGAAVAHKNTVYCMSRSSNTAVIFPIYRYMLDEDEWQEHSHCPHDDPGLAIISDLLTAVGGKAGSQKTNKLVSWKDGKWVEEFPPMNTPRFEHAVVSDGRYVIAAGGKDEASVELFTISSNTWATVTSLPQPFTMITATLCGPYLYAMDDDGATYSMFLSDVATDALTKLSPSQSGWQRLSQKVPVRWSTLCTMNGAVVAVGGIRGLSPTSHIHQCLQNGEWVQIGCMHSARLCPIVAVLPGDRMVVVGGLSASSDTAVEVAVLC